MAEPINPIFPITEITSIEQLMDIAVGVEREAAMRYEQLARQVERQGDRPLADTFRELAELEWAHQHGLERWARREGRPAPQARLFTWHFPETFSAEDADGAPLSPYRALSVAVRNEERAFAFYTYLSALASADPDVQKRAEALAGEELKHVAQLRHLRRRAYHAGHPAAPPVVTSDEDLRRLATRLELQAAERIGQAAALLEQSGRRGDALLLRQAENRARRFVTTAEPASATQPSADPAQALVRAEHEARATLDTYLTIAERAQDEAILQQAQSLAESAMARLAVIRALM